jgi:hypothetical protein
MSFFRRQKGYREMRVGGRLAANSISCGRGACQWAVRVSGTSEVSILTLDPDESAKTGPDEKGRLAMESFITLALVNGFVLIRGDGGRARLAAWILPA